MSEPLTPEGIELNRLRELFDVAAKREAELREALAGTVHAMRVWGSWEDGVPASDESGAMADVGKAFDRAVFLLGWEENWGSRKSLIALAKETARIRELETEVADLKAECERLRRECPVHADQVHGAEAEELRQGIEALASNSWGESVDADSLINLLEGVDARDSLAFIERVKVPLQAEIARLQERVLRTDAAEAWAAGYEGGWSDAMNGRDPNERENPYMDEGRRE